MKVFCRLWPLASIVLALAFFPVNYILTQSLSPVVTASGGGYLEGERGSLSYTVGEAAIATYTGRTAVLTEGFQQTDLVINSLPSSAVQLDVLIFPNPTSAAVTVTVPAAAGPVEMQLITAQGQNLSAYRTTSNMAIEISLDPYPAGVYYLRATDSAARAASTYKIVKTR